MRASAAPRGGCADYLGNEFFTEECFAAKVEEVVKQPQERIADEVVGATKYGKQQDETSDVADPPFEGDSRRFDLPRVHSQGGEFAGGEGSEPGSGYHERLKSRLVGGDRSPRCLSILALARHTET